jgi:HK97 family phage portal protein
MKKMSLFEKTAFQYGRARAQIERGWDSVFLKSWNDPSISDPSAWLDPDRWGAALTEGRKPETKREFIEAFTSWVFICVKLKGQAVASVPMKLYVAKEKRGQKFKNTETKPVSKQRLKWLYSNEGLESWLTKAEEIEEVTDHVFLTLMREVNPWNNRRDLWETTSMFLDLTGEAYWYLPKTGLQVPARIWVIPSQFMTPKRGKTLEEAIDHYEYRRGGVETSIAVDEIIFFALSNPNNPFTGFSTIKAIADAVYIQRQMNEFEASLFENKARPGGILVPKAKMSRAERERTVESFRQKYAGARKAGKTLIPPADMNFIRDAMTPEEISFIEGRRLVRTEIMASLDVPEGMIITESSNRAVAEAAEYIFAKYGILPRCRKVEEKLNEKLVSRYDEKLFCAFDDPVPENRELKLKENTEYVKVGAVSRDEIRAGIGKEPRGGMADELLVDNRLVPITSGPAEKQAEVFLEKIISAARRIIG